MDCKRNRGLNIVHKKEGERGGRALLTQNITQQISPLSHLHLYSAFSHWRIPSGSATQCERKRNEHNGTTSRPGIVTCEVCFSQATSRVFRVTAGSPWSPPKDLAGQQSYRRSERYVYLIWTISSMFASGNTPYANHQLLKLLPAYLSQQFSRHQLLLRVPYQ